MTDYSFFSKRENTTRQTTPITINKKERILNMELQIITEANIPAIGEAKNEAKVYRGSIFFHKIIPPSSELPNLFIMVRDMRISTIILPIISPP